VLQIYNKIICMFIFTFFPEDKYTWLRLIPLLVTSGLFFYTHMYKRPYLNRTITLTWCLVSGIYFWTNCILCLNQLLDFSEFTGGLELAFCTYPLVALIIIFHPDPLEKKLMTPFKDLASGYDCYDHIRYFVYLASHNTIENRVCLEGYIKKCSEEKNEDASLLRYNQSISQTQQLENGPREGAQAKRVKLDQQRKLMDHALHLFLKGLAKFPKCTFLRIQCALFLLEKMKKKSLALKQLFKTEKRNPPFDEQFLIYRLKYGLVCTTTGRRVIEEEMTESSEQDSGAASLDIVSALAYQNHRQHWETYMEMAAQLHTKFWTYLTEDVNDLGKLSEIGSQINSTLALVEEHWERMQKYRQNSAKVIRLYASFLSQVLNDKEGYKDLMKSVSDGKALVDDPYDMGENDELQELNKFAEGGCGVIVASGDSNIGKINKISMGVCSVFGYTKSELIGKDVSVLVPKAYGNSHATLISAGINKVDDKSVTKERHVYARHKSGYIMAIDKTIKSIPSILNNWQYVVCVQFDKKKSDLLLATVLVNTNLEITDVSFRISSS
jgi:PAS domain S-box-containing protein